MTSRLNERIQCRLQQLDATGLRRQARVVETLPGGCCRVSGVDAVNFGGNDYLDLAHDARVCEAFRDAAALQAGSTASAAVAGRSRLHDTLEAELADFENTDAALLFPAGYAANFGTLTAIVEDRDAVFCDRDSHASLIDAARACAGRMFVYHRDRLDRLTTALEKRRGEFDQAFIVTDSVFSMDGTVAPLADLCVIAERFEAAVVVDEAHGTGVLGHAGRGAVELLGVESKVAVKVGTLSKALGGLGGFVAADRSTIEWLRNAARTQFFSTALPPAVTAAALQALHIVRIEPQRRTVLQRLTGLAHQTIRDLGLTSIGDGPAPIVAVVIEDDSAAVNLSTDLLKRGWFVPAIRPPTVRRGTARLRLSLSSAHSDADVVAVLKEVRRLLD